MARKKKPTPPVSQFEPVAADWADAYALQGFLGNHRVDSTQKHVISEFRDVANRAWLVTCGACKVSITVSDEEVQKFLNRAEEYKAKQNSIFESPIGPFKIPSATASTTSKKPSSIMPPGWYPGGDWGPGIYKGAVTAYDELTWPPKPAKPPKPLKTVPKYEDESQEDYIHRLKTLELLLGEANMQTPEVEVEEPEKPKRHRLDALEL